MIKKKSDTYCEIWLPYFKQGDDLGWHLRPDKETGQVNTACEAFQLHSQQMQHVSDILQNISNILRKYPVDGVSAEGDTHHIHVEGPPELIQELVKEELGNIPEWHDEEEYFEDNHYLEHNGITGTIEYDPDHDGYHGKLDVEDNLVCYQGDDPDELNESFEAAVESYLRKKNE